MADSTGRGERRHGRRVGCYSANEGAYADGRERHQGARRRRASASRSTTDGYLLCSQVTSCTPASFDAVIDGGAQAVLDAGATKASHELARGLHASRRSVSVDPRYGTWDGRLGRRASHRTATPPAVDLLNPAA